MRLRLALGFMLLSSAALAQSGVAVKQSGNVTPNQVPYWVTSGVIGGGVTSADSPISSFGVTNNGFNGICSNSDRITAAGRNTICIGSKTNGPSQITVQNYGTATPQPFQFVINGTTITPAGGITALTVGATTIGSGTNQALLYNNNGILGNTLTLPPSFIVSSDQVSYVAPFTGAVSETQTVRNAQRLAITDFGCVADSGVTDNGPCLRAAYDAAAVIGASIYIPPSSGYYGVSTCRNDGAFDGTSITVPNGNKSVSIYGAGWNEKPFATPQGSWLLPNTSFPSSCSWIHLSGSDKVSGTTYSNFGIGEFGGALGTPKGLNGLYCDASANPTTFYVQNLKVDHVYIANMATGKSIKVTTGTAASAGCFPDSSITNSKFMNFNADFLADHFTIDKNTIGQNAVVDSRNIGIEFANCGGCTSTEISNNNISNFNGMIVVNGANKPNIHNNELEQSGGSTNANGALVDLNGGVALIEGASVSGNQFAQNSLVANYAPIKVANAISTQIYDNRIALAATPAYDYVTITGAASGTFFGYNRCEFNGPATPDLTCGAGVTSLGPSGFQYWPFGFSLPGIVSGRVIITPQSAQGAPALLWPTTSGTLAASATSPLVLSATTGTLTCPTCATTAGGGTISTLTFGTHLTSGGASYNGSAGVTITSDATAVNTASTIMARDGSGQVAATTFTGALAGNATTATTASAVAVGGITGLGTGVATALAVNIGTAGSFVVNGGALGSPSSAGTLPAHSLGGTISGGGNQINNVIIGTTTPLAGSFTTLSASTSLTSPLHIGGSGTTGTQLTLQTTSGVGTTDQMVVNGGNAGATRVATFLGTGITGFGSASGAASPSNTIVEISANTTANSGTVTAYTTMLHVTSADNVNGSITSDAFGTGIPAINMRQANGTAASKTATANDAFIFVLNGDGYNGSSYNFGTQITAAASQTWTAGANGTRLAFSTIPNGSTTLGEAMRIQNSGGVSIGTTTDPGIGSLQVNATVVAPNLTSDAGLTDTTLCWKNTATTGTFLKGSGTLGICLGTSGAQFKTAFAPMVGGLYEITKLHFQNYRYKNGFVDSGERMQYGLTAQDVEIVLPDLVRHDEMGEAVNYDAGALLFIGLRAIQQ